MEGRRRLDGSPADLAVSLGEVGIAGGEQGALGPYREQGTGAGHDRFTSMFPPFSRGGLVRRPSAAMTSSAGRRRAAPVARRPHRPPRAPAHGPRSAPADLVDGATPRMPMNGRPGMRRPGRSGDVAQPSASSHRARNGAGNSSLRNPKPGNWAVYPKDAGPTSRMSTTSRSPGSAPSTRWVPSAGAPTFGRSAAGRRASSPS